MYQRSFLKWLGGKFKILDRIIAHIKTPLKHWYEPFMGSGAVFLNVEAEHYTLADANPHLINMYQTLQQEGGEFVRYVKQYFKPNNNSPEVYYALRALFNETRCIRERSALFIYLNRHGFNGLCRYNKKGGFNVPFGLYRAPYFPEDEMHAFYHKAQRATFLCQDFKQFFEHDMVDGMVYCDPPYVPLSKSAAFTAYAAGGFGMPDQQELAVLAKAHAATGASVLISNHDTPMVRNWYEGAFIETFPVMRSIAASTQGRKNVQEILALFLPSAGSNTVDRTNNRRSKNAQSTECK